MKYILTYLLTYLYIHIHTFVSYRLDSTRRRKIVELELETDGEKRGVRARENEMK